MRTVLVNQDPMVIVKIEEINHAKRGLEYRYTLQIKGIDEDGDAFIYKARASAPLTLKLALRDEIAPLTAIMKYFGVDGEKYFRIEKLISREGKNVKKVNSQD
jgi:hypothetical protein